MAVGTYWGHHALFDCASCDIDKITSKENVHNFIKELVPAIEMIAFGEPMIEHFATHEPDKAGISFLQMIETSNISGHLVDSNGDAYIDIFSCKTVDVKIAEELIVKYFNPKKIRLNFITRSAG
jgi:S-adenosylmethionine/arginine decarboxylase-like enzyme